MSSLRKITDHSRNIIIFLLLLMLVIGLLLYFSPSIQTGVSRAGIIPGGEEGEPENFVPPELTDEEIGALVGECDNIVFLDEDSPGYVNYSYDKYEDKNYGRLKTNTKGHFAYDRKTNAWTLSNEVSQGLAFDCWLDAIQGTWQLEDLQGWTVQVHGNPVVNLMISVRLINKSTLEFSYSGNMLDQDANLREVSGKGTADVSKASKDGPWSIYQSDPITLEPELDGYLFLQTDNGVMYHLGFAGGDGDFSLIKISDEYIDQSPGQAAVQTPEPEDSLPPADENGEQEINQDWIDWKIEGGVLRIWGQGYMDNYTADAGAPWSSEKGKIKTVIIEEGVASIGAWAFSDCTYMTSISIPDSVKYIGSNAFMNCESLESISIPDGITVIEHLTFFGCSSLSTVKISDSVTYIGRAAFCNCDNLRTVIIPNGVETIEDLAFGYCKNLKNTVIPDSVTYLGSNAFVGCWELEEIRIPSKIKSIDVAAFSDCRALTSVEISNGVTVIKAYAFSNCPSLVSIIIPRSVTLIEEEAFYYSPNLVIICEEGSYAHQFAQKHSKNYSLK